MRSGKYKPLKIYFNTMSYKTEFTPKKKFLSKSSANDLKEYNNTE